jgi:hypothetical protein
MIMLTGAGTLIQTALRAALSFRTAVILLAFRGLAAGLHVGSRETLGSTFRGAARRAGFRLADE